MDWLLSVTPVLVMVLAGALCMEDALSVRSLFITLPSSEKDRRPLSVAAASSSGRASNGSVQASCRP